LFTGAYNEAESHQQFLDALNAWRNAGKPASSAEEKEEKKEKVQYFPNSNIYI